MKHHKQTTVYLIRHGETDGNREHKFQGSIDYPLNDRGMAQAACLRKGMEHVHLDGIFSSPLKRVIATAEQVRGDRDMEVTVIPGIREINCGEWEGKNREEIEALWPGRLCLWQYEPEKLHMPGGETLAEVQERVVSALLELVRVNRGKSIAVVSSMLAIQLIVAKLLDVPIHNVWDIPQMGNTAVSTVKIEENGDFEVVQWADHSHLTEELRNTQAKTAGFDTREPSGQGAVRVEGRHHFDGLSIFP